jgi:hypothetical protein
MSEYAPVPPDPESERRGHELRDVAIRPILYFLIGLFVFGGLLQTVMSTIMQGYVVPDTKLGVPADSVEDIRAARTLQRRILDESLHDNGKTGDNVRPAPSPPLQRDTTADMLRMYDDEDKILTTYHKDDKTGQLRIPIDRAMKILAKKGLPHRDTPADKIDKELPYPTRSDPYMAKY